MTVTRQIVRLGFLAGLLASAASVQAGEAVIFSGTAPQAAELARILWPGKQRAATVGATRSIRINADIAPAAPAAARPAAHVEVAAAEPTITSDAAPGPAPAAVDAVADAFGFPIAFAFDSTEVLPESRPYLDSVGAMLGLPEAKDKRVVIVGHTDATGSDQYNQALSERRAAAVRAYLETRFKVAAERLEIRGEGENQPLADTDPYAAQNRRVEFHAAG